MIASAAKEPPAWIARSGQLSLIPRPIQTSKAVSEGGFSLRAPPENEPLFPLALSRCLRPPPVRLPRKPTGVEAFREVLSPHHRVVPTAAPVRWRTATPRTVAVVGLLDHSSPSRKGATRRVTTPIARPAIAPHVKRPRQFKGPKTSLSLI